MAVADRDVERGVGLVEAIEAFEALDEELVDDLVELAHGGNRSEGGKERRGCAGAATPGEGAVRR